MKRMISIAMIALAAMAAACGPGTDGDTNSDTFPAGSAPVETLTPLDLPSVEPSVDASMEPSASPS